MSSTVWESVPTKCDVIHEKFPICDDVRLRESYHVKEDKQCYEYKQDYEEDKQCYEDKQYENVNLLKCHCVEPQTPSCNEIKLRVNEGLCNDVDKQEKDFDDNCDALPGILKLIFQ